MPERLDLQKLRRIIGMVGSAHDGEVVNAFRQADRLIRTAGMTWLDFVLAVEREAVATEGAAVLLDELTAVKAELDQLRTTGSAVALWQDVGAKVNDARRAAEWALDVYRRRLVWLSPDFEVAFLTRCTTWTGRLTPKMQPIFQRLMDRIVERTGMTPPP